MVNEGCFGLWTWDCKREGCDGGSKKPLSRMKARRSAIKHNHKFHNDYESEPVLTKVEE